MKVYRKEVTISATNDTADRNATAVSALQGAYTPITAVQTAMAEVSMLQGANITITTAQTVMAAVSTLQGAKRQ